MSRRGRARTWWPALLLSLGAHLVPLFAAHLDLRPRHLPTPPSPPLAIRYRPAPPPVRSTTTIAAPETESPPRRITIERRRRIHLPPRPHSAPRPVLPQPAAPPPIFTTPEFELPNPVQPPPHPLVDALRQSTSLEGASVPVGRKVLRLKFLFPFEPPLVEGPVVLLAADATPPEDAEGVDWSEVPADHRLFHRPHEVRDWWESWDAPPARLGRREGQVVALWLPPLVRAGWEAEHPDALAFWDNLAAWAGPGGLLTSGGEGVKTDPGGTFAPLEE